MMGHANNKWKRQLEMIRLERDSSERGSSSAPSQTSTPRAKLPKALEEKQSTTDRPNVAKQTAAEVKQSRPCHDWWRREGKQKTHAAVRMKIGYSFGKEDDRETENLKC